VPWAHDIVPAAFGDLDHGFAPSGLDALALTPGAGRIHNNCNAPR
jgi:hypothetical protein